MARLRVIQGNEKDRGKAFELPAFEWVIGRGTKSDVLLDDPRASRQHACVRLHRGAWMVRDLGSAGGTFVNQQKAEEWTAVHDGDRIRLGRTVFAFEDPPDTAQAPPAPPAASPASAPSPAFAPLPDQIDVPGHHVYDKIGDGATGSVYRGRHLELDRAVAIKVLAPALAKKRDYVKRFEREARAAAKLFHPHVVSVYQVGHHRGLHYFTMELMEQGTVEDRLLAAPGSRLPWPEAVALVSDAALGLAHVHQHGLVHRDIKPANLLLDVDGVVKLGDLGTLVREADAEAARIGTPHFMSPEQARREPVTRASDVYSLGATLYRMLTGETPHKGETLRDVMRAVAHDTPHPIEALREGLPQVVADEINAMMARDPADRPVDAAEVGERLAAAVQDVQDHRQSRRDQRRRRTSAQEIGVRLLALVVVLVALFVLREPIRRGIADLTGGATSPAVPPSADDVPEGTAVVPPPAPPPPAVRAATEVEIASRFTRIRQMEQSRQPLVAGSADVLAAWRSIAREYEDFVDSHPLESPRVMEAHRRARSIRHALAEVAPPSRSVADAVDQRLVRDFERAGAGALTTGEPAPPVLRLVKGGVPNLMRTTRFQVLSAAQAQVDGGDAAGAFPVVIAWIRDSRAGAGAGSTSEAQDRETIRGAIDWLRHTGRVVAVRLADDVGRDAALLAQHLPRTGFFGGLDGLADPGIALTRLSTLQAYMVTPLGVARCHDRRARLEAERETWATAFSSGASPDSVADAIVAGAGTIPRENLDGALWLLLEAGRRYRAEELLSERRLLTTESRDLLRVQLEALRELATMGDPPAAARVASWSARYPSIDLVLVATVTRLDGFAVFSADAVRGLLDSWGAAPR